MGADAGGARRALNPPPTAPSTTGRGGPLFQATCAGCGRSLDGRTAFEFQMDDGPVLKCFACALRHGPMLARSARIALIVGTLLTAINHGDSLVGGHWLAAMIWKIPLTYAMPFVVATWGALSNGRAQNRR